MWQNTEKILSAVPVPTHNFDSESRLWAVNCSSPPPPFVSWSCWEVGGHPQRRVETYSEICSNLEEMLWLLGDIRHRLGIRSRRVEGAPWIKTNPWRPATTSNFPCSQKVLPHVPLNNSYCNFGPALLSLFAEATRTGLSASSDPVTFMIKSALKLPYSSLLLPGAKWSLPTALGLNLDEALLLHVKWLAKPKSLAGSASGAHILSPFLDTARGPWTKSNETRNGLENPGPRPLTCGI